MKPAYSIQELADILGESTYRIVDALAACGVKPTFRGNVADLSGWTGGVVKTGKDSFVINDSYYQRPDPSDVIVSTDALPESYKQSLFALENAKFAKMYKWWKKPKLSGNDFSHFIYLDDVCEKYPQSKGAIATEIENNGIWFLDDFGRPKKVINDQTPQVLASLFDIRDVDKKLSLISALFGATDARTQSYNLGWPIDEIPDFEHLIAVPIDDRKTTGVPGIEPYSTPLLEIQKAAIAEFFAPRQKVDASKDVVVPWIKEEMIKAGLSESDNIAQAIFTIIKPNDHNPRKRRG